MFFGDQCSLNLANFSEKLIAAYGIAALRFSLTAKARGRTLSLDYSRTMKEKSHRVFRRCYRSGVDALRGTQTRRLDGHTLYSASHLQIRAERQAAGRRLRPVARQLRRWGAPAQGDRHPVGVDQAAGSVSRGRPPAGQGS